MKLSKIAALALSLTLSTSLFALEIQGGKPISKTFQFSIHTANRSDSDMVVFSTSAGTTSSLNCVSNFLDYYDSLNSLKLLLDLESKDTCLIVFKCIKKLPGDGTKLINIEVNRSTQKIETISLPDICSLDPYAAIETDTLNG